MPPVQFGTFFQFRNVPSGISRDLAEHIAGDALDADYAALSQHPEDTDVLLFRMEGNAKDVFIATGRDVAVVAPHVRFNENSPGEPGMPPIGQVPADFYRQIQKNLRPMN